MCKWATKRKKGKSKNYQIKENSRRRINRALKGNSKALSSLEVLGCSIDFYKNWLEYNFYKGMTWKNSGTYLEQDHVRPCNLSDPEQQKEQLEKWSALKNR